MISPYSLSLSNGLFVEELYVEWKNDSSSVDPAWDAYFRGVENGKPPGPSGAEQSPIFPASPPARVDQDKQGRVNALLWAYRDIGYLYADLNPLKSYMTPELRYMLFSIEGNYESLSLKEFNLCEEDLDKEFAAGRYFQPETTTLRELIAKAKQTYCSTIGVEILHIQNKPMRRWLIERMEHPDRQYVWDDQQKQRFQKDLIKAEEFERFVHTNFIGQKRFSLEGSEALIPAVSYLVRSAADHNLQEIVLGMSHRGRLNVFTNALRKRGADTFSIFIDNYKPHTYGGSGDVKYHLGHSFTYTDKTSGKKIHISLVANPSHLEAVDPVVEGKTRAIQRRRADRNRKKVLPILIHGDAAFSGQGIVAETLNLSLLKGYRTGGTIHIIVNNQIGFTTASRDARSTFFATDIAKTLPVPIFHVNGDDPEAVIRAIDLAMRWRQKFGYDAIVDIIAYRRLGHNEADEPSFTHPIMYELIKKHPSAAVQYGRKLADAGAFSEADQNAFREQYKKVLRDELKLARDGYEPDIDDAYQGGDWAKFSRTYSFQPAETGVDHATLKKVAECLTTVPQDFNHHPKLTRFIADRAEAFGAGSGIDWAFAESLAFGSLLLEGYAVRLSGEDCARGTFSQRHAEWWDVKSVAPKTYTPLEHVSPDQASFSVYDSPLSEYSVLGFEYGYSIAQPDILVMWEAQFGDFVNGAQVIIDTYIAAGETKWFRSTGLVLLLPHGYEGQGPEHSSAHIERFLQLCAEDNMQVCAPSTPAQYFHMLRRQMKQDFRKPLIVMTPKSLLRHKRCVSDVVELTEGHYRTVIDDSFDAAGKRKVETILICSGKVCFDLLDRKEKRADSRTAIVRFEQVYPFDAETLKGIVQTYPASAKLVWVQEESENRGAWSFVEPRLRELFPDRPPSYVGRPASASPATGSHNQHAEELERLLTDAFE